MRIFLLVLAAYSFALVGQVLAGNNTKVFDKLDTHWDTLRSIKSYVALPVETKLDLKNLNTEPQLSSAPVSQSLATYTVNFIAICEAQNKQDERRSWEYSFLTARCTPRRGNGRPMSITCTSRFNYHNGPIRWRRGRKKMVSYECPVNTVCRRVTLVNTGGPSREEVACVDQEDVRTDRVTATNSNSDPNVPNVHCGTPLALPGTEFVVKPGVHSIDVTLTEEAQFSDGSPYPAPMLYILDKTSWRGFDRVFRRDASVASTQLTLTAVAGKFQTRTFLFCMQLLPGITASAVTFTYSWFQTTSRHGRIPKSLHLEQKSYEDRSLE